MTVAPPDRCGELGSPLFLRAALCLKSCSVLLLWKMTAGDWTGLTCKLDGAWEEQDADSERPGCLSQAPGQLGDSQGGSG